MKVNKNVARVFSVLLIIFVLCSSLMPVFAEQFVPDPNQANPGALGDKVENAGYKILGVVQIVAGFAAVILLITLAIKYMTSSPEGKADIKKTAIIYVIGAFVLFGASSILGIIKDNAEF